MVANDSGVCKITNYRNACEVNLAKNFASTDTSQKLLSVSKVKHYEKNLLEKSRDTILYNI